MTTTCTSTSDDHDPTTSTFNVVVDVHVLVDVVGLFQKPMARSHSGKLRGASRRIAPMRLEVYFSDGSGLF